jgi:HTH-type transcriptional regulator / antitoxin HipB
MADIAASIRGRRQELGLSQSALAERSGVSRKWVSELESGKPSAEIALVMRILRELGFSIDLSLDDRKPDIEVSSSLASIPVDLDSLLERYRGE